MSIEDVVLVSTVREDIRGHALQVDLAEIPLRVEAEQLGARGLEIPVHLRFPKREESSSADLKRVSAHEGDDEHSVSPSCRPFLEGRSTVELTNFAGRGRGIRKYGRVKWRIGTACEERRSGRDAHC